MDGDAGAEVAVDALGGHRARMRSRSFHPGSYQLKAASATTGVRIPFVPACFKQVAHPRSSLISPRRRFELENGGLDIMIARHRQERPPTLRGSRTSRSFGTFGIELRRDAPQHQRRSVQRPGRSRSRACRRLTASQSSRRFGAMAPRGGEPHLPRRRAARWRRALQGRPSTRRSSRSGRAGR